MFSPRIVFIASLLVASAAVWWFRPFWQGKAYAWYGSSSSLIVALWLCLAVAIFLALGLIVKRALANLKSNPIVPTTRVRRLILPITAVGMSLSFAGAFILLEELTMRGGMRWSVIETVWTLGGMGLIAYAFYRFWKRP